MLMPDEKRLRPDCKSDEGFHQRRERAAAALESCTASQPLNASEQHLLRYCSCTDGAFGMQRYTPYACEDPGGDSKIRVEMRAKIQRSERRRPRSRRSPRSDRNPGEESGGDVPAPRPDSGTHAGAVARAILKNFVERSKAWPQSAATDTDISVMMMLQQRLHLLTPEERNQTEELMMAAILTIGEQASRRAGMVSPSIEHLACNGTPPVEHLVAADEALEEEKDVAETGREENADPEEEEAVPEEKKIASEDEGTKKKNPKTKKAVRRISHPTQPSSFWSIWYAAVLAAVLLLHWWSIWMLLEGEGSSEGGRSRKKHPRRRKNTGRSSS